MAIDPYQSDTPVLLHRETQLTFELRSANGGRYDCRFDTLEAAAEFAREEMKSDPCRYWIDLQMSYVGVPATRGAEANAGPRKVAVMHFEVSKTDVIRCPGMEKTLSKLAYEAAGGTKTDD